MDHPLDTSKQKPAPQPFAPDRAHYVGGGHCLSPDVHAKINSMANGANPARMAGTGKTC